VFLLLIDEKNDDFREKEVADCGGLSLRAYCAKVALLWAG